MKQIIYFFIPAFCLYLLASFCSLSFIIPFNFIISDNIWIIILRALIFIVHIFWAYYLYELYQDDLKIEKAKNYSGGFIIFENYLEYFYKIVGERFNLTYKSHNCIEYTQLDENTILIKKAI